MKRFKVYLLKREDLRIFLMHLHASSESAAKEIARHSFALDGDIVVAEEVKAAEVTERALSAADALVASLPASALTERYKEARALV